MSTDSADPLFTPLTIAEVMERTGRSKKTIDRWIKNAQLRVVRLENPAEDVVIERELLELEADMRCRAQANRDRIAAMAGRRGPRKSTEIAPG